MKTLPNIRFAEDIVDWVQFVKSMPARNSIISTEQIATSIYKYKTILAKFSCMDDSIGK